MVTRKQFEKALRVVKEYQEQSKSEIDTLKKELEVIENTKIVNIDVDKSICDIDISVRLFNVLAKFFRIEFKILNCNLIKVSDLADVSLKSFRGYRTVGDACIKELMSILHYAGIQPKP
jgi:uncharacterized protein (UPF0371 family)